MDAYVSRGIMACPQVGDMEVLDSSRHRMTAGFGCEGCRQRDILLQVGRSPGGAWEGYAPAVVRVGSVCLLARSLGPLKPFAFWGPGEPGVPSFQSGLFCDASERREQRQRSLALPD